VPVLGDAAPFALVPDAGAAVPLAVLVVVTAVVAVALLLALVTAVVAVALLLALVTGVAVVPLALVTGVAAAPPPSPRLFRPAEPLICCNAPNRSWRKAWRSCPTDPAEVCAAASALPVLVAAAVVEPVVAAAVVEAAPMAAVVVAVEPAAAVPAVFVAGVVELAWDAETVCVSALSSAVDKLFPELLPFDATSLDSEEPWRPPPWCPPRRAAGRARAVSAARLADWVAPEIA
jgi:hypothetical protein